MRQAIKVGDVFEVPLDVRTKKYFQYIANDRSQLGADVIRAFTKLYVVGDEPKIEHIVDGDVEFHAHVVINWGIKMRLWRRVGNSSDLGTQKMLFRDTDDYGVKEGESPIEISENWYVWRIDEPFQHVGRLEGANRAAEIGVVVSPVDIVARMRTGKYDFVYPGFE